MFVDKVLTSIKNIAVIFIAVIIVIIVPTTNGGGFNM